MKRFFALALACLLIYTNFAAVSVMAKGAPSIVSETAVVIDGGSGQILYDKNSHTRMYPASTTKILTGLLAVELGNMEDVITYSHDAVYSIGRGTSHASISEGEQLTLEQSMYALSIESANDAAAGIGEYLSAKSGKTIGELMTERAKELGALDSNFVNPHGLPDPNHYTTAYDLAIIAKEAIKHEEFNKIFSAKTYSIPPTNKQSETRTFNSQNWFFNGVMRYDGNFSREDMLMSKTGWTSEAQHTMVTALNHEGMTLICVVMKSTHGDTKFEDTEKLFNWAIDNFRGAKVTGEYIALCAEDDLNCDERGRLYIEKENIVAPDVMVVLRNGEKVNNIKAEYSVPVLSADMQTAEMTATLYTGNAKDKTIVARVPVTAAVSERTAVSALPEVEVSVLSDTFMCVLFGLLTFIAVMICDILIAKRV